MGFQSVKHRSQLKQSFLRSNTETKSVDSVSIWIHHSFIIIKSGINLNHFLGALSLTTNNELYWRRKWEVENDETQTEIQFIERLNNLPWQKLRKIPKYEQRRKRALSIVDLWDSVRSFIDEGRERKLPVISYERGLGFIREEERDLSILQIMSVADIVMKRLKKSRKKINLQCIE